MIAARVADELREKNKVDVEVGKGGIGELSVYFDDRRVIDTSRFWYPTPGSIVKKAQALLAETPQNT